MIQILANTLYAPPLFPNHSISAQISQSKALNRQKQAIWDYAQLFQITQLQNIHQSEALPFYDYSTWWLASLEIRYSVLRFPLSSILGEGGTCREYSWWWRRASCLFEFCRGAQLHGGCQWSLREFPLRWSLRNFKVAQVPDPFEGFGKYHRFEKCLWRSSRFETCLGDPSMELCRLFLTAQAAFKIH